MSRLAIISAWLCTLSACRGTAAAPLAADAGEPGDPVLDELTASRAKEGAVLAWCFRGAAPSTRMAASFYGQVQAPQSRERTFTKNCVTVETKTRSDVGETSYGAGVMSIVHPAGNVTIDEPPTNPYLLEVPRTLWSPGDRVSFSFTGNTVPAFSTDLVFPADFELLGPKDGSGVRPTDDLLVTWMTSGAPSDVFIEIKQVISLPAMMLASTYALCRGRDGEAELTIPKEVMGRFVVEDAAQNIPAARFTFIPHPRYMVSAGDFRVLVDVGEATTEFALPFH